MKLKTIALANVLLLVAFNVRGEQALDIGCEKAEVATSPNRKLVRNPKKPSRRVKMVKKSKAPTPMVAPKYGECNTTLFSGIWTYVGGICRNLFGVMIDCGEGTENAGFCDYTERVVEYSSGDDASNACDVGGTFPRLGMNQVTYDSCTGDCTLEYFDLSYDPCKLYSSTGLGLKAVINIMDTDSMDIYFSNDGGASFYNDNEPRKADRLATELEIEDYEEEPAERGSNRRSLSEMDKEASVASSSSCEQPTDYFSLNLIPADDKLVELDKVIGSYIGGSSDVIAFEDRTIFNWDWLNLADCDNDNECEMKAWLTAAGTDLGSLPGVIDTWKGLISEGGSFGDVIDGVGDILNVGATMFPPLAIAGGIAKTVGVVFGQSDAENIELLNNIIADIEQINNKLDALNTQIAEGIERVVDRIDRLDFDQCMDRVKLLSKDNLFLNLMRGRYVAFLESTKCSKTCVQAHADNIVTFSKDCTDRIHYSILVSLLSLVKNWDGCMTRTFESQFKRNPDDYDTTFVEWVRALYLELQTLEGFCSGVLGYANPGFTDKVREFDEAIEAKRYCRPTPEETLDYKCTANQYCKVKENGEFVRECRDRYSIGDADVCKGDDGNPRHNMCTSGKCQHVTGSFEPVTVCKKFLWWKYSCKTTTTHWERWSCVPNVPIPQ